MCLSKLEIYYLNTMPRLIVFSFNILDELKLEQRQPNSN